MTTTAARPQGIEQIPCYRDAVSRKADIDRQLKETQAAAALLNSKGDSVDDAARALLEGKTPEDAIELAHQREAVARNLQVLQRASELAQKAIEDARHKAAHQLRAAYLEDHQRIAARMRSAMESLLEAAAEELALEQEAGIAWGSPWASLNIQQWKHRIETWLNEVSDYAGV